MKNLLSRIEQIAANYLLSNLKPYFAASYSEQDILMLEEAHLFRRQTV